MSMTVTNVDLGNVILESGRFEDNALLTFAGAGTVAEGTILAVQEVAEAIVAAADGGNTGDGTVTLATVQTGPVIPLVGAYNLECVAAVAEGGVFKLVDPNGAEVANDITMTPGALGTTVINVAGMEFTITDGATDFAVGDKFSLTVAADGNWVPFAKAGVGGAQVPKSVITYDVVAAGAGNEPIRPMLSGVVRKQRLIIALDGDDSNVDRTVRDQLRDYSIVVKDVNEIRKLDNQ